MATSSYTERIIRAFESGQRARMEREREEEEKQDRELARKQLKLQMDRLKIQQAMEERKTRRSEALENFGLLRGLPARQAAPEDIPVGETSIPKSTMGEVPETFPIRNLPVNIPGIYGTNLSLRPETQEEINESKLREFMQGLGQKELEQQMEPPKTQFAPPGSTPVTTTGAGEVFLGETLPERPTTIGRGRTITKVGPDGRPHLFQYTPETDEFDRDLGLDPKALQAGGISPRQSSQAQGEATRFDSSPIVKQYNEVQNKFQSVKAITESWTGPADLALVFEFMKSLDPTSVVRESEYEAAAKSGNIFKGWAARFNGAVRPEGGFLSENVRKEFLRLIGEKSKVITGQYRNLRKETAKQIDRITGQKGGEDWLKDYESAFPAESEQKPVTMTLGGRIYRLQPDGTYK